MSKKRGEIPGPGIERAGAYRTADGELHATRDEARTHNAVLGIEAWGRRVGWPGTESEDGQERSDHSTVTTDMIIEDAAELLPLLRELLRKPASKPQEPAE